MFSSVLLIGSMKCGEEEDESIHHRTRRGVRGHGMRGSRGFFARGGGSVRRPHRFSSGALAGGEPFVFLSMKLFSPVLQEDPDYDRLIDELSMVGEDVLPFRYRKGPLELVIDGRTETGVMCYLSEIPLLEE